ncbi:MAG: N(G),N(G)-dimethylarginine dimethylaminohydrolase [Candidatus Bathyarchaeota archaeon]|nr:MAG: N(G),N(G)-dimethylarginine dimethylaminohydrolase [Candidatus Bathyarchaeota archaeon]
MYKDPSKYAIVRPVPNSYAKCVRRNKERIDVALARKQHKRYCDAIRELGLELIWIQRADNLPDSCFVEDTAVVIGEKAVICNMKVKSRAEEVTKVANAMKGLRDTHFIKPPATIDGGDVLTIENKVFVGITSRTNMYAANQLKNIVKNTGFEIIPVKISTVLHLKSACTYLGNKTVVLSKGHFNIDCLQGLRRILVPKDEEYAADCLAINGKVIVAEDYPKTKRLVEKHGYEVRTLDISEFRKCEGALTCLSIIV